MAAASTVRHETRALLRAHLAAASGYRHATERCAVCRRLLRLAMELPDDAFDSYESDAYEGADGCPEGPGASGDGPREPEGPGGPDGLTAGRIGVAGATAPEDGPRDGPESGSGNPARAPRS
ncbi:DUF6274 family protein [Streptomyces sp. SP18CS02]|uniref:DUF6274 family protein n=1 Tax=Streptomyces sp. SP18CS02 TaxID=3002531 RepID=UPI002E7906A5|nr:DUF6274 family protein [Streptomyces sp. SP18CS02]MEE1754150.1 DUF6274 family protein [Streptomyces sp. SP18CS02]